MVAKLVAKQQCACGSMYWVTEAHSEPVCPACYGKVQKQKFGRTQEQDHARLMLLVSQNIAPQPLQAA